MKIFALIFLIILFENYLFEVIRNNEKIDSILIDQSNELQNNDEIIFANELDILSKELNEISDQIKNNEDIIFELSKIRNFKFISHTINTKNYLFDNTENSDISFKEKNANFNSLKKEIYKSNSGISFYNKLIKKNSFEVAKKNIQNIYFFQMRLNFDQNIKFYNLIQHDLSIISIYDSFGNILIENYEVGQINLIGISNYIENLFISVLGNDNKVNNYVIVEKKKNTPIISLELSDSFNLFEGTEILNINQILFYVFKTSRYFILSDKTGSINVYLRNGTFHGKIDVSEELISIHRFYPNIIYATESKIAFFNPLTLQTSNIICEKPDSKIKQMETDQVSNNIIYILLENNDILIYEIKYSSGVCKKIQKIKNKIDSFSNAKLFVSKNYVYLQSDKNSSKLQIFNVSDINSETGEYESFEIEIQEKEISNNSIVRLNFQKNSYQSFYLSHLESYLMDNKITIFEILIPSRQTSDFLDNIRMPLIILAVGGVIVYQFFFKNKTKKTDNKLSSNFNNKGKSKNKSDEQDVSKINKYSETLNYLNNKTQEMSESLEKLKGSAEKNLNDYKPHKKY